MKIATKLGTNHYVIIGLTLLTAIIHLAMTRSGGLVMLLNGLGYLGLLVAYYVQFDFLPVKRDWIRWAFMAFAALTIVAYFASWGMDSFSNPIGLATKIIELGLILMLWRDK
jgi:hypothetical protein